MNVKDITQETLRKAFTCDPQTVDVPGTIRQYVDLPGEDTEVMVRDFETQPLEEAITLHKDKLHKDHLAFLGGLLYAKWKVEGRKAAGVMAAEFVCHKKLDCDKSRRVAAMATPAVAQLVKNKALRLHSAYYLVLLPRDLQNEVCQSAESAKKAAKRVAFLNSLKAKGEQEAKAAKGEQKAAKKLAKAAKKLAKSLKADEDQTRNYRRALQSLIRRLREPGEMSEFKKGQALAEAKTFAPDLFLPEL